MPAVSGKLPAGQIWSHILELAIYHDCMLRRVCEWKYYLGAMAGKVFVPSPAILSEPKGKLQNT
jgi:hypothetical protein